MVNDTLRDGSTLQGGKYRIVKILGQGGFGITYLAEQKMLKSTFAIKEFFMRDLCARDENFTVYTLTQAEMVGRYRQKFIKEAQLIAKHKHPGIVKVSDIFEENDTVYYVMEYIEGESLGDIVKREGPLSEQRALRYISKVAEALDFLHQSHVNHLDVKPNNIMVRREDDMPILIDFGVSKQYDEHKDETSTTPPGISHGYSPLEQYKNGGVSTFSPQADIYALGATLYKLLTGNTPPEALDVINYGIPALPANVSFGVRKAIEKAMKPMVVDRPKSIEEFVNILEKKASPPPPPPPPPEKPEDDEGPNVNEKTRPLDNDEDKEKEGPNVNEKTRPLDNDKDKEKENDRDGGGDPPESPWKWWVLGGMAGFFAIILLMSIFKQSPGQKPESNSDSFMVFTDSSAAEVEKEEEAVEEEVKDVTFPNGLTPHYAESVTEEQKRVLDNLIENMVRVEGGTFTMGEEHDSDAYVGEAPEHDVTLSDFHIAKYEVTQEEWKTVMGDNPSEYKGGKRPVEKVSWEDCQKFIDKLNQMTGLKFRLPTEAQWEFAAKGGNKSNGYKYAGSDDIDDVAWYGQNSGYTTHPVGQKAPNELGLYDMAGNVWEWCQDWKGDYSSSDQKDPTGPTTGSSRVNRGGSWHDGARYCRVSFRFDFSPDYRSDDLGLRLAL